MNLKQASKWVEQNKWSWVYEGSTYDVSILQWYKSDSQVTETVLGPGAWICPQLAMCTTTLTLNAVQWLRGTAPRHLSSQDRKQAMSHSVVCHSAKMTCSVGI